MLNLSDKELDRFSKEAAQEYEPGDVLGERSWERLEVSLDRDLGRVSPNPLQHIRRFPFYYAPALLVLLGVSYYFIRQGTKGSGGPPGSNVKAPATVVHNPLSSQSPVYPDKSTPASSTANPSNSADYAAGSGVSGTAAGAGNSAGSGANGAATGAGNNAKNPAGSNTGGKAAGNTGSTARSSVAAGGDVTGVASGGVVSGGIASDVTSAKGRTNSSMRSSAGAGAGRSHNHRDRRGNTTVRKDATEYGKDGLAAGGQQTGAEGTSMQGIDAQGNDVAHLQPAVHQQASRPRELSRATMMGLQSTKKTANIDDSALRAFTLKSTAPQWIRNRGMHINRSLQFGVVAAPDFASVNSLAGDRPGSTLGLTVDYQFASRWYIGTGLLLDRKNYAARGQDFHAPPDYFQQNGIHGDVELVKGSFEMLEIPLNLRYDFSVSGSTLFFAEAGLSSYLFGSENNNFYYHMLLNPRQEVCTPASNSDKSYLFSTLNLSMGVETGLSNSLSLLIAPYMKAPVRGIGVGQVQMSSVGINFVLKWAPVISRKRY